MENINISQAQVLLEHLRRCSEQICRENGCTEDNHKCESYAYIRKDGMLLDVCCSDYFQGTSAPYAAIPLPIGDHMTAKDLMEEILEQCSDFNAIEKIA